MTKSNNVAKIDQIDAFHKTRKGRLSFGFAELLIAYLLVSLAIDSGSLWQYIVALLLIIGGVNNLVRAFTEGKKTNGKKPAKKR